MVLKKLQNLKIFQQTLIIEVNGTLSSHFKEKSDANFYLCMTLQSKRQTVAEDNTKCKKQKQCN